VLVDAQLDRTAGITIAFTGRLGGVSQPPFDTLNLAGHVGDEASAVNENRDRLLHCLGIAHLRRRVITAQQVHGDRVAVIDATDAGRGAEVDAGRPPVPAADALVTTSAGLPLLLLFADCVPVVLVAPGPSPGVAVVHAGWRGALSKLPGKAARVLAHQAAVAPSELLAYIGPHIGECCYEVDDTMLSQFCNAFDTIAPVAGRLDLGAAVRESLAEAGVSPARVVDAGICTLDHVDRFFSYRASNETGRHGALAVITKGA